MEGIQPRSRDSPSSDCNGKIDSTTDISPSRLPRNRCLFDSLSGVLGALLTIWSAAYLAWHLWEMTAEDPAADTVGTAALEPWYFSWFFCIHSTAPVHNDRYL